MMGRAVRQRRVSLAASDRQPTERASHPQQVEVETVDRVMDCHTGSLTLP